MAKSRLLNVLSNTTWGSGLAILAVVALWNSCSCALHEDVSRHWHDTWKWIYYDIFAANDFVMAVFGTYLMTTVWFWSINVVFLIVDVLNKPAFFVRYKVQPDKNAPVSIPALLNCVRVVLWNQTVVGLPFNVVAYFVLRWRGCPGLPEDLPSFNRFVLEILVFTIVEEIGFYYTHLLLHQPYFYKRIHKKHHEWTAPIGIVALYSEWVEHILSNLFPVVLGPFLMGSHVATQWIWMLAALMTTTVTHSGYHLPFLVSPEFHDFHHASFTSNFGVLGILDWLHGTDKKFMQSPAYQRHKFLFGFRTMRALYPDKKEE